MTIGIVGSSHIAALKQALDRGLLPRADAEWAFWGARGPLLERISVREAVLHANGILAEESVRLVSGFSTADFDASTFAAVVFHGIGFNFSALCDSLAQSRERGDQFETSFLRAGCRDWITRQLGWSWARQVRPFVQVPILLSPIPYPSEKAVPCYGDDVLAPIAAFVEAEFTQLCKEEGFEPLLQDRATLSHPTRTLARYAEDGARLAAARVPDDMIHMNHLYGAVVLKNIQVLADAGTAKKALACA